MTRGSVLLPGWWGAVRLSLSIVVLTLLSSVLVPAPRATAAGSDDAAALASALGECTQQFGGADVILMLDQSLSLQTTDPQMVRRDASRDLARQLAAFGERAEVDLRMQVAGFDGIYHAGAWHDLDSDLPDVLREIGRVADNTGLGPATDYWMALDGARQQFAQATADGGAACQFLIWFSDGQYDVDENGTFGTELPYAPGVTVSPSTKADVIETGKDSICSPKQGPVNPLRATGVFVATVGLNANGNVDLSFLRNATDGSQGCGRPPEPGHAAYLETEEAGALALAIAQLGGGQLVEGGYDDGQAALSFGLDEAVSRASVLAYAGPTDQEAEFGLSGPDGEVSWWDGDSGPGTVAGAAVAFERVTGQSARFTIDRPADPATWRGRWTVHFRTDSDLGPEVRAQMVVTVTGDLAPVWTNPLTETETAATIPVSIALRFASGEAFTRDHPGVRVSVAYLDAQGRATTLESDLRVPDLASARSIVLPASPGEGRLSLRLDLITDADPPTPVAPAVTTYPLSLVVPGRYPTVGAVQFDPVEGPDASPGRVSVVGPGCVWVDPRRSAEAVQSLPDGVSEVTVGSESSDKASCRQLAEGEAVELPVTLLPSAQGNGSIVGAVSVWAAPDGPGEDLEFVVPFTAQRTKAADESTKWAVFALVLLAGLALSAVPLFLVRSNVARIVVRDSRGPLQVARRRFRVEGGDVTDLSGGMFRIDPQDISQATSGSADRVRRVDLDGVTLQARWFGNPFAYPDCEVSSQGPVVTSRSTAAGGATPGLPLALAGEWIARPEPDGSFSGMFFLSNADVIDSELPMTAGAVADSLRRCATALASVQRLVPAAVSPGGPPIAPPATEWAGPNPAGPPAPDPTGSPGSNPGAAGPGAGRATSPPAGPDWGWGDPGGSDWGGSSQGPRDRPRGDGW